MSDLIETKNLIGRPVSDGDIVRLRILHNDDRVMATLSATGQKISRDASAKILGRFLIAHDEAGRGVWMFHTRTDGTFVGYAGGMKYMDNGLNDTEVLYAVPFTEWRKGYGTEMAGAMIRHLFNSSGITELISFTLPTNVGSRRVMEKNGMEFERTFTHAGLEHVLYRLTRTRWAGRGGQL